MSQEIKLTASSVLMDFAHDLSLRSSKLQRMGRFREADILTVFSQQLRKESRGRTNVGRLRQILDPK